jgi:ADP-dependent NAD(P)H-hydrate dehydratase / NAD(P)H-hydrate epimerase
MTVGVIQDVSVRGGPPHSCARLCRAQSKYAMKLLSADESRELDRLSREKYGIESYRLMTNAGEAVAAAVTEKYADALGPGVLVVAGKGNNGGDGMVAARRLMQDGIGVRALLLTRGASLRGDAARAHSEFVAAGGEVAEVESEPALAREISRRPGVVIDAIFGTGLNAEVTGLARRAIESLNSTGAPVVAVDIASGVNSDTGAIMGAAVRASLSVTFGFAKFGHVSYPGAEHCGELQVADIGFDPEAVKDLAARGRLLEATDVRGWIEPRAANSHKGMYGHVMVVAGGRGKAGAALLAARGALRMGAGLVTAAVPASIAEIVAAGQAELMTEPVADCDGHFDGYAAAKTLSGLVQRISALVVGPGLGVSDGTKDLVSWLIAEAATPARPMLLDADALNVLAELGAEKLMEARGPIVLTPHPGEMSRLLRTSVGEVNADRISAAKRLCERTGATVLLKGARSVMAAPGGELYVNSSGNPGMSTPGMGDALSGMVGTLLGQKLAPAKALGLGVYLHGYAADRVAERYGKVGYIVADLVEELPRAIEALACGSRYN